MMELRDVDVRYAKPPVHAVRRLSMTINSGEIVAILGKSGCGKSSLLRAIAGLEPATGQILLNGRDISALPTHRRKVGMLFQDGQLFPHRNVERNISYGLEMIDMSAAERRERVAQMLEMVGMAGYGKRAISTLSGGQAQRVALARTLAVRPDIILLDEPLSALDRLLRLRLGEEIHHIVQKSGMTALYVTHDREEAIAVADQIAVMDGGELIGMGTYQEMRERTSVPIIRDLLS
ncbi:ABC transporter ATP-binding protein [Trueperella sp. LYQ143]|uniref:ABC transporter ATP-binding protein n=1 Tax=Trueperella sp. LYQ143 TaxID=3391059 RepID=UPI003983C7FE